MRKIGPKRENRFKRLRRKLHMLAVSWCQFVRITMGKFDVLNLKFLSGALLQSDLAMYKNFLFFGRDFQFLFL